MGKILTRCRDFRENYFLYNHACHLVEREKSKKAFHEHKNKSRSLVSSLYHAFSPFSFLFHESRDCRPLSTRDGWCQRTGSHCDSIDFDVVFCLEISRKQRQGKA